MLVGRLAVPRLERVVLPEGAARVRQKYFITVTAHLRNTRISTTADLKTAAHMYICMCIYIYIYIHTHIHLSLNMYYIYTCVSIICKQTHE